ncbi:MAG: hypothetical protein PHY45_03455 [Rhodocyclaceae bacterium]|nr:hypothetical protein [Rhodocyclaceae bacterium]
MPFQGFPFTPTARRGKFSGAVLAAAAIAIIVSVTAAADEAPDVAMITSVQGDVTRAVAQGQQPVPAFVKLRRGDRLALGNARLQVVYFDSGRQELWRGDGRLEIGAGASKAAGLPEPEVRTLPDIMVKQIARTPALASQGRAGVVRLRSLPSPAAADQLESTYRQIRSWAAPDDLNPELYLLSGLFELREFERIEEVLAGLRQARPGDAAAAQAIAFYQQALKDAQ